MPSKDKYSDPKLRDEIKEELHNSDKGGPAGKWSARKAQMMAQEYKRRGGTYNTDKSEQDESQKHLSKWTEEEWQTKEGSGHARQEDGTEKRYLPKRAWEQMDEEEKEATDQKKLEGSKAGKQHVGNTRKAKAARKNANEEESEQFEKKKEQEKANTSRTRQTKNEDDNDAAGDGEEAEAKQEDDGEAANAGQKRKKGGAKQSNGTASNKKRKSTKSSSNEGNAPEGTIGSKHMKDEEPAPRGSADRLPKKGQQVTWKAMPGFVDGKVQEVLRSTKTVDGKSVKASKHDPKIVLKSSSSGKICVHKPDACFYE